MAVEMLSTWRVTVRKLRGDARGANHTQGEPKTGSVVSCWISHVPPARRCGAQGGAPRYEPLRPYGFAWPATRSVRQFKTPDSSQHQSH